jgi:hypothetical protein
LGRRRRQSAAASRLLLGVCYALLDNLAELYFDALDLNLSLCSSLLPRPFLGGVMVWCYCYRPGLAMASRAVMWW